MKPIYDKSGDALQMSAYPIAAATAITRGQAVKLTNGKIVAATQSDSKYAVVGIAAETHSGVKDPLNCRSDGTEILVYNSPTLVGDLKPFTLPVSETGTTTITSDSLSGYDGGELVGGFVQLADKAADSSNNDPIGTVYSIITFTYDEEDEAYDFKLSGCSGSYGASDTYVIYPAVGFNLGGISTNSDEINLSSDVYPVYTVESIDFARGIVRVGFRTSAHK